MIVLDASALLAYLFRESGHESVEPYLNDACISTVNLSEVLGRFARNGVDALPVIQHLEKTTIEIVPFTLEHAVRAANYLPQTKPFGLLLGDRACLGLASARKLPALTADVVWLGLENLNVEIIPIR